MNRLIHYPIDASVSQDECQFQSVATVPWSGDSYEVCLYGRRLLEPHLSYSKDYASRPYSVASLHKMSISEE